MSEYVDKEILRLKAFHDLRSVELPYFPGGLRYRVSENEALCILDGYFGFDGSAKKGCHVIDTVPIMYLRGGELYTAPHIASVMRDEIMHSAARVALNSSKCMKLFIDYVWHTVGIPPKFWTYIALYEHCVLNMKTLSTESDQLI